MIIRRFIIEDLEQVIQLYYDVIHSVATKYYNEEQVSAWAPKEGPNREKWLESLSSNYTYIAEADGAIIAFGDMTHQGYVDRLFVHKNYQGSGAAVRIFRKLEDEARKLHLSEMTGEASVILMPIAQRYGFEVVDKQLKTVRGVQLTNYKMRKKLLYS